MKRTFIASKDILIDDGNATALSAMVDDPKLSADADGQKYLRAGTLMTADTNFALEDTDPKVMTPTTDVSKAQGVLRNDYNVVDGAQPAAILVAGTINRHRMDDTTKGVYTDSNIASLKSVLPKITVIDRN